MNRLFRFLAGFVILTVLIIFGGWLGITGTTQIIDELSIEQVILGSFVLVRRHCMSAGTIVIRIFRTGARAKTPICSAISRAIISIWYIL